jgi:hypothetical protein
MVGHWLTYGLAKERQAHLMHEAEVARAVLSSSGVRSLPSGLRSLLVLLLPLN